VVGTSLFLQICGIGNQNTTIRLKKPSQQLALNNAHYINSNSEKATSERTVELDQNDRITE